MRDNENNSDFNTSEDDMLNDITSSLADQINQEIDAMISISDEEDESPDDYVETKKKSRFPRWLKILSIVFSVVMVVSIGGMYAVSHYLDRINYTDWSNTEKLSEEFDQDDIDGLDVVDPNSISLISGGSLRTDQDVINILLVGEEAMFDGGSRGRTDSMMIATINVKQKALKLTSIMRDLYVAIPGYSDNKLNAAYHNGGMPLLKQTIEENFDIELDGSVLVNFAGFEEIINRLGGVEITLTANEAAYLNRTNYISNPIYRNVRAGTQTLNGNQALGYSRVRYVRTETESDDFGRTSRQRTVLNAIFDKYKSKSLPELVTILYDILPLVTTDINKSTIMDYLTTVVTLGTTELETMRIPVDNAFSNSSVRGMSVLLPNSLQDNIDALHTFIFGSEENATLGTEGESTGEANQGSSNTNGTTSSVGTTNSTRMQP
ncbi:transcriptional attenuator, LytR family [Anaerosporobacter mobilis DSM 15930]|jgi:LCP family protein required for cell wall assembly|uniref:Transcriptional attenuator, LytR family n=1 Tax=Anaerosporobacter mobilis DSM 15930 TaxID=1120996 RepID=A0A1M7GYH0_9FIRM|nr:LCP family protein [Anaerosporobacter mobilis]SHM21280.1 transcriptional attenuator, LytR family [Anaerosporobacter mobilis DSM 15930]